ncbi:AAA domain protein [Candidatus Norongarragalina meridionalis]|nr:AAA domain protein [Candidatus Norongarragalina meridionalis]
MARFVVGFAGSIASGKGEAVAQAAKLLKAKTYSLSDELRANLRKKRKPVTRKALRALGNELRRKYGTGVLAEAVAKKAAAVRGAVIVDSIRCVGEAQALRKAFGKKFVLVFVDAPLRVRFNRAKKRGREGEASSFTEFKRVDAKEMADAEKWGHSLRKVKKMADVVLKNDASLSILYSRIRLLLTKSSSRLLRAVR